MPLAQPGGSSTTRLAILMPQSSHQLRRIDPHAAKWQHNHMISRVWKLDDRLGEGDLINVATLQEAVQHLRRCECGLGEVDVLPIGGTGGLHMRGDAAGGNAASKVQGAAWVGRWQENPMQDLRRWSLALPGDCKELSISGG